MVVLAAVVVVVVWLVVVLKVEAFVVESVVVVSVRQPQSSRSAIVVESPAPCFVDSAFAWG